MRKFLCMILVLSLVLGMGTAAFAETSNDTTGKLGHTVETSTCNEYAMLKELAKESEFSLVKQGYTKSEIVEIKDYKENYTKHLEKLDKLEDQGLTNLGYDEEQIKMIRTFKGSEAELYGLSATLSLNVVKTDFRYKETERSRGTFSYEWTWSGIPMSTSTDIVAASWNDWEIVSRSSTIKYYDMTTGSYEKSTTGTRKDPTSSGGIAGAGYTFPLRISKENLFAKNGKVSLNLISDVFSRKVFYFYAAYGHTVLSVSPSFALSGSGINVGIEFSSGVEKLSPKKGNSTPKVIS